MQRRRHRGPPVVGSRFPATAGSALSGERVRFPADLAGRPAVLLVAYRRGAQPDIDRWTAFLGWQAPWLRCFEVPVIPQLTWRPLAGWIDAGMRGGVPRDSWGHVVTLYEEGAVVRDFVGDRGTDTAHVVLLDGGGTVAWFCDTGFSEEAGRALLDALETAEGRSDPG